jgi:hypothetical protein
MVDLMKNIEQKVGAGENPLYVVAEAAMGMPSSGAGR